MGGATQADARSGGADVHLPHPNPTAGRLIHEIAVDAGAQGCRRTWHAPCVLQASEAYGLSVGRCCGDKTATGCRVSSDTDA